MITILDYQSGNLKSLQNALERQGLPSKISANPDEILKSDLVILPGVGAFEDAMTALRNSALDNVLAQRFQSGKPILGICLGMQLFFEDSDEALNDHFVSGLGFLKGKIRRLRPNDPALKVPHMGWNQLQSTEDCPLELSKDCLPQLSSYNHANVYFVHSYGLVDTKPEYVKLYTNHGQIIPALVYKSCSILENQNLQGALMGFQFHPEKSGLQGEQLLAEAIQILTTKQK